ncbi:MCP four helix bundle domain-containing protein [Larkinella sp. VNQ87]|uniref:MCP four helix bundle domain-containing protein n=1 Tax=Larkinella sp. VNQ87 TaxID=3400921 RepID=UPI003C11E9A6
MKWSFVIQQKIKAAVLLTGVMLLVVLCTVLSRRNMKGMDRSCSSMYQDRLIPAVDMVYLSENLYTKRLLLENFLFSNADLAPAEVSGQLIERNQSIDSLIRNVEQTFLIAEEAKSLQLFKNRVNAYALLEKDILHLSREGRLQESRELFKSQGAATFQHSIKTLNQLTDIQSAVGRKLVKASHGESSEFNLLSSLQISIAIVIGLLILGLIYNSKIINKEKQPFHLN